MQGKTKKFSMFSLKIQGFSRVCPSPAAKCFQASVSCTISSVFPEKSNWESSTAPKATAKPRDMRSVTCSPQSRIENSTPNTDSKLKSTVPTVALVYFSPILCRLRQSAVENSARYNAFPAAPMERCCGMPSVTATLPQPQRLHCTAASRHRPKSDYRRRLGKSAQCPSNR